jgi:hypothetical protein
VEGISILGNSLDKAVVQAPCQQLSWQLGYLKRSVLFCLLSVVQDYYNQLPLLGPELSIPDAMFMQHFVHGLGTEFAKYLDMTSGGVFVHCTVEEGKSILDKILLVTPHEDLQIKAPLLSEDESIITYLDASYISALPAREELL